MSSHAGNYAAGSAAYSKDTSSGATRITLPSVTKNIHSVRGLACLLIVAFHVIGDDAGEGLHLPDDSAWHYAMKSIVFLRLPLFTVIAGYFYGGHRVTRPYFIPFWSKKLRRIALPFACVTIIVWLLRRQIYVEPKSLLDAFLYGYGQLWFLEALLVIFAAMSVWDVVSRPGSGALVLAGLTAVMITQSFNDITQFLSLSDALRLTPYFLFGILLRERGEWVRDPRIGRFALGIVAIVLISQQFAMNGLANEISRLQLPAVIAGMAGAVFLVQRLPQTPLLEIVGNYSYTIFLWHVVIGAAARLVFMKLGIVSTPALFTLIFFAAVLGPILLHHALRWAPLLCMALTGEKGLPRGTKLFGWRTPKTLDGAAPVR
jgi:peptidoglycan/LPS O-acetylase OafA/YrhL